MLDKDAPGAVGPRAGSGFVGFGGATTPTIAQANRDRKKGDFRRNTRTRTKESPKLEVRALGPAGPFLVVGQVAKALLALVEAKARGRTALEVASWAYRFGAYIWTLRHEHGLAIETEREDHEGGWHARYVLRTPVTVLRVFPPKGERT